MSHPLTDLIARAAAWHAAGVPTTLAEAREALLARRFGIHYHPVLQTHSGERLGYCAGARFARPDGLALPPGDVFAALHTQPALLLHAEIELKRLALTHAPRDAQLWVCVDSDSYTAADSPSGNALVELLDSRAIVVRAVENRPATDVRKVQAMLRGLAAHRIAISLEAESAVTGWASPLAIDADWLQMTLTPGERLRSHRRLGQLERTLADAHCAGTRSLLTGLCDLGDLALAAELGFTVVSGPLFDAASFTVWESAADDRSAQVA